MWHIVDCQCPCHSGGRCGITSCGCGMSGCGKGTLQTTIQDEDIERRVIILNDIDGSVMKVLKKKLPLRKRTRSKMIID